MRIGFCTKFATTCFVHDKISRRISPLRCFWPIEKAVNGTTRTKLEVLATLAQGRDNTFIRDDNVSIRVRCPPRRLPQLSLLHGFKYLIVVCFKLVKLRP